MEQNETLEELTGKFLLAMPGMGDPRFEHSVVFICKHSDKGAMGLIVNKRANDLKFTELLQQLDIEPAPDMRPIEVHFGGPVEFGRGFVLHSADYMTDEATLKVSPKIGMTTTLDILEDISQGLGPKDCILAMGYSGWGPGQLEAEIAQNGWLICDASHDIIFGGDDEGKWTLALRKMGIDPMMLSSEGGNA